MTRADDIIRLTSARGQRIRVRRADIYQVVAYARHAKLKTDKVVLLYPVALREGEEYPAPLKVREFDPICHLAFFDVGPSANSNRVNLYAALERL
jgi:5-methylcytosine-specific restriction enzyme subunit McrC